MGKVMKVNSKGKISLKDCDKYVVSKSPQYGDCPVCWEPMNLKINCETEEETLFCSNDDICKNEIKLKNKLFGNRTKHMYVSSNICYN